LVDIDFLLNTGYVT